MNSSKDSISLYLPEISDELVGFEDIKEEYVEDTAHNNIQTVPIYFKKLKEEIIIDDRQDLWPTLEVQPGGIIKHIHKAGVKRKACENKTKEVVKYELRDIPLFRCAKCSESFTEIHILVQHLRTHEPVVIKKKCHFKNNNKLSRDSKTLIITAIHEDHDYYKIDKRCKIK